MSFKLRAFRFTRTASCHDLRPEADMRAIRSKARAFELRRMGIIR